jgi:hypothetical protein
MSSAVTDPRESRALQLVDQSAARLLAVFRFAPEQRDASLFAFFQQTLFSSSIFLAAALAFIHLCGSR